MYTNRTQRSPAIFLLAAVAAGGLLAACGDTTTEAGPDPVPFEGSIMTPPNYPDFFGNVWVNAGTQAIGISLAFQSEPETRDGFYWNLREGSCEAPGALIGVEDDYPTIVLDEEGTWSGSVNVAVADAEALAMEVEFLPADADEDGEPFHLGCATLTPRQ